jgi:threonylcarbamoyladenosine tRNA methylthiotransferase MtaB
MKTYFINTLGCKVNQFESDTLAQELEAAGYTRAKAEDQADLCIVNTCTVTQKASMQSRQSIRNLIRRHPDARVIATGCYAQTAPEEIREIEGVDAVVPNSQKNTIAQSLPRPIDIEDLSGSPRKSSAPNADLHSTGNTDHSNRRTRPFLKIQDGCEAFCTYCIVPYARGKSRSMQPTDVMTHLTGYSQAGYREVVLTGIHLGCYGLDLSPPTTLVELLTRIEVGSDMDRIRLSSIEPRELNEEIVRLVATSKRLCRHFHIPLQSGDDEILQRMNRPYTGGMFRALVRRIRREIPDAAIGADILVGFPGETEAAFETTYNLIKELQLTYLHVFPFSPRKGTPAAKFTGKVKEATIKKRAKALRELGAQKRADFFEKQKGETAAVLIEAKPDRRTGLLKGLTSNYIPVLVDGDESSINAFVTVKLDRTAQHQEMIGKIISTSDQCFPR